MFGSNKQSMKLLIDTEAAWTWVEVDHTDSEKAYHPRKSVSYKENSKPFEIVNGTTKTEAHKA